MGFVHYDLHHNFSFSTDFDLLSFRTQLPNSVAFVVAFVISYTNTTFGSVAFAVAFVSYDKSSEYRASGAKTNPTTKKWLPGQIPRRNLRFRKLRQKLSQILRRELRLGRALIFQFLQRVLRSLQFLQRVLRSLQFLQRGLRIRYRKQNLDLIGLRCAVPSPLSPTCARSLYRLCAWIVD